MNQQGFPFNANMVAVRQDTSKYLFIFIFLNLPKMIIKYSLVQVVSQYFQIYKTILQMYIWEAS